MSTLDEQYIDRISAQLGIVKKQDGVWNLRCPDCGDSKTNKRKMRGYFHYGRIRGKQTDDIIYSCRNCGASYRLDGFIKKFCSQHYNQYRLDKLARKNVYKIVQKPAKKASPDFKYINTKITECYSNVADLPDTHEAKKYLIGRMIPDISDFGYTTNFSRYVDEQTNCAEEYKNVPKDERIIIPIKNPDGQLIGFQGRALGDSDLRYVTIKTDPDNFCKIYGLDKFDKNRAGFLLEGAFDSSFFPNSLSMCGSSLDPLAIEFGYIIPRNLIVVYDNEPRNKEIVEKMLDMASKGFRVYVPTKSLSTKDKDVNLRILSGESVKSIAEGFIENSYKGTRAELMIRNWSKI